MILREFRGPLSTEALDHDLLPAHPAPDLLFFVESMKQSVDRARTEPWENGSTIGLETTRFRSRSPSHRTFIVTFGRLLRSGG